MNEQHKSSNNSNHKDRKHEEKELRKSLLTYRLMGELHCLLTKRKRYSNSDFSGKTPHAAPLILSLALISITLVLLVIFGYDPPASAWVHLYLGALIFMLFWSAETIIRKVIEFLKYAEKEQPKSEQWDKLWQALRLKVSEFVEDTEKEQSKSEQTQPKSKQWDDMWQALHLNGNLYLQALPGLGLAILGMLVLPIIFREIFHQEPGWPLIILAGCTGFFWGTGATISMLSSIVFTRRINPKLFHLYAFDPQKSAIITTLSDMFETALWANSVGVVVLLLPLLFVKRTLLLVLVGATVSAVGFGILIGLFVLAQTRLAWLVRCRKEDVATDLQDHIEELVYSQDKLLDISTLEKVQPSMEFLMGLREQVVKTRGWGLSTTRPAKYLRSFILPTIVAVYANWGLIQTIYNAFVKSLFN